MSFRSLLSVMISATLSNVGGMASAAHAQFVPTDDTRRIWCTTNISSNRDYDKAGGVEYAPLGQPWSLWIPAGSSLAAGSFCNANGRQNSVIDAHTLSVACHVDSDFLWMRGVNMGIYNESQAEMTFQVTRDTPVLVFSKLELVVEDTSPSVKGGDLAGLIFFNGTSSGDNIVVDQHSLHDIGSHSVTREFATVLTAGEYAVNIGLNAMKAERAHGDVRLDVMAGCAQDTVSYQFPSSGISVEATVEFAGETATQTLQMTGDIKATLVRDCEGTPIGLRLTEMNLITIQPSVTWTINPDIALTIGNMHATVGGGLGEAGGIAPIQNNCCGELLGVAPYVTGDAVLSLYGTDTPAPLSFLFPGLYAGIPFNVGSVLAGKDLSTISLDVSFTQEADFGLGSKNPIVTWSGVMVGTGGACGKADFNCDGTVDGADLGELLGAWSATVNSPGCGGLSFPCAPDMNLDGKVDGADLGTLLGEWSV